MVTSNQITPGISISIGKKIYLVESSMRVNVAKGVPFVKTKLRDLRTDEIIEKNFKLDQEIQEVTLVEKQLEYLYLEGKGYLFLDMNDLEQLLIPASVLGDKINYLKEGIIITAMFYGDAAFSIELPLYLELMIVKTDNAAEKVSVSNSLKKAILETGAEVEVPLFIESGDVIKVDTQKNEYIQRV